MKSSSSSVADFKMFFKGRKLEDHCVYFTSIVIYTPTVNTVRYYLIITYKLSNTEKLV